MKQRRSGENLGLALIFLYGRLPFWFYSNLEVIIAMFLNKSIDDCSKPIRNLIQFLRINRRALVSSSGKIEESASYSSERTSSDIELSWSADPELSAERSTFFCWPFV